MDTRVEPAPCTGRHWWAEGFEHKRRPPATERQHQNEVVRYLRMMRPRPPLFCATIGGISASAGSMGREKRSGYTPGVPDLLVFEPSEHYHGLAIEMKAGPYSRVTESQAHWHGDLNERGYLAVVARGYREAISIIDDYLAGCCVCHSQNEGGVTLGGVL